MTTWKKLSKYEELEYRQWVRETFNLNTTTDPTWHPVVRDELRLMREEKRNYGRELPRRRIGEAQYGRA